VLRNSETLLAVAASKASENAERVICLTGTPIQNGPSDASGQLRAMMSGSDFEDSSLFGKNSVLCSKAVHMFNSEFIYSATMADAGVSLPTKTSQTVWISHDLSESNINVYNECLSSLQGTNETACAPLKRCNH